MVPVYWILINKPEVPDLMKVKNIIREQINNQHLHFKSWKTSELSQISATLILTGSEAPSVVWSTSKIWLKLSKCG